MTSRAGSASSNDLTALAREHDREPGLTVAIDAEYLEVVATRK